MAAGSTLRKVAKWLVIILAGLYAIFCLVVVPYLFVGLITTHRFHFRDPDDSETPENLGMAYQPVEFHTSDGVLIKGWYVPAGTEPAKGTIVYCHGLNRTRVEMLPMAQFGHSLGYDGVLFDFRHQGASGGNLGSIGYWERRDPEAAIRYALSQQKAPHPVILWGVSMGASAALMAAAQDPDVAGVISDSSFLSFEDTIRHHWTLVHHWAPFTRIVPTFPVVDEVIYGSAWRAHFNPADFDLQKAVRKIDPRPVLFIGVEGDVRMPPAIARELYADSDSPGKMLVVLPGTRHGEGFKSGHEQYVEAVTRFLANLRSGQPPAVSASSRSK